MDNKFKKIVSNLLTACALINFTFSNVGTLTHANRKKRKCSTNRTQVKLDSKLPTVEREVSVDSQPTGTTKKTDLDVKVDDSLAVGKSDEMSLMNLFDHQRHIFKGGKLRELASKILDSMGEKRSNSYNKWCLSVLMRIYQDEKSVESVIVKANEKIGVDKEECDNDANLLNLAISLLLNEPFTTKNQKIIKIAEQIKNDYIHILRVENFKREKFSKHPDYYKLDIIHSLFLCSKSGKFLDPKIINECYNAIDINLLKGDSIISKKMLLVYASFEYDAKKSVEIIKSLILNGIPFEQAVAAKESKVLKKAVLQFAKIPQTNNTHRIAALNAIIGNTDSYAEAAGSNDPIKREALLQLAKIPNGDGKNQLDALNAIIGNQGNPNRYKDAIKTNDPIKREAVLQFAKIPQTNNTDRIAALNAIIGNTDSYAEAAGSNDPIKREALLQLAKIPNGDGKNQLDALNAIIGNQGNPNRYKDAIKTNDPIKREAVLQFAKIPQGDGTDQIAAIDAIIGNMGNPNRYKDAIKTNDPIKREAVLQFAKIPQTNNTDRIAALNAIIGNMGNTNRYKVAAESNDPIKREAVLQFTKIPQTNNTDRIAALNAIIGNTGDRNRYEIAAGSNDPIKREALLQLAKIPNGDGKNQLDALNAIIGNTGNRNRYKIAAGSNDPIKREALLQLAKIPNGNGKNQLDALNAIIGNMGNRNRYKIAAGSNDPIKREALLQLAKIPQIKNTDRLAALYAIIGNTGRYEETAESNDPIKREAVLQLGKIPGDIPRQTAALYAIIGNNGNPNRYKIAAESNDPIKRGALLQLGKIPHGDGKNQLDALYALCDYIARDNYRLNVEMNADDKSHVMYYYKVLRNGGDFGEDIISTLINAAKGIKDEVSKNKLRGRLNIAFIIYSEQRYEELRRAKVNFKLINKYKNIIVRHSGFLSPKLKVTLSSLKEVIQSTIR